MIMRLLIRVVILQGVPIFMIVDFDGFAIAILSFYFLSRFAFGTPQIRILIRVFLRWSGKPGENWVLTSQTHGKSSSDKTAAL